MARRVFILLLSGLAACGASGPTRRAISAITAVADPAYAELLSRCDAAEGLAIEASKTKAEAVARVAEVRKPCNLAAEAFEAAREAQLAADIAADALDACEPALRVECASAAAAALSTAKRAWDRARRALHGIH